MSSIEYNTWMRSAKRVLLAALVLGGAVALGDPPRLPEPSALGVRYYETGKIWWLVRNAWAFLGPALFLWMGLAPRLKDWAWRVGRRWYAAWALFLLGYWAFVFALDLPVAWLGGFVREHLYGLSDQAASKWWLDEAKAFVVVFIGTAAFLWVPFRIAMRSPKWWWAITGALVVPYFFFTMLITPIWIAPLFNDFYPMKDKALETKIVTLARRAGVTADRIYEVNKSVDTKRMNAYVAGFLGTKRIVLWDTLLARMDHDEVLAVMGHEIGHYVLGHVNQGILVYAFFTFLGLFFLHVAAGRLGISLTALDSLPKLSLLLSAFAFVVTPLGLAFSRHLEHEADRFSLELLRNNEAEMSVTVKFVEKDLAYPRPDAWVKYLRYSHPTPGERFDFAATYRPWEKGEPLVYGRYIGAGSD